jgi:hypothetical protein
MKPIILKKDIKIKRIINISDVHIKNRNDREKEYNEVFNLLSSGKLLFKHVLKDCICSFISKGRFISLSN